MPSNIDIQTEPQGNGNSSFQLLLVPFSTEVCGTEASLVFIQNAGTPEGSIYLSITIQLSECTDIVGMALKRLQLFAPYFKCTVENIKKEISRLLTQDLSWTPSVYSYQKEQVLRTLGSQWLRPNALCCKQHYQHEIQRISSLNMAGLSNVLPEPVLKVNLQLASWARAISHLLEFWGEHAPVQLRSILVDVLAAKRKGTSVCCTAATPGIGNHLKWICKVKRDQYKNGN